VAAGIDGIMNQLECPPTRSEGCEGTKLPATLGAALDALEKDTVMTEALGSEFIAWFVLLKKHEMEVLSGCDVNSISEERFDKERKLYIDLL
jgi:glutamine synthetase